MIAFVNLLLVCAVAQVAHGALRCDSPLRVLYPQYFTHCDYAYLEWSDWSQIDGTRAIDPACSSGESYQETRSRTSIGGGCDETETRRKCVPSVQELLISSLGLGNAGTQNTQSVSSSISAGPSSSSSGIPSTTSGFSNTAAQSLIFQSMSRPNVYSNSRPVIYQPVSNANSYPPVSFYYGSSALQINSGPTAGRPSTSPPTSSTPNPYSVSRPVQRCPAKTGQNAEICTNLYQSRARRVAAREEYFGAPSVKNGKKQNRTIAPPDSNPLPFVWKDDHMLFRRQVRQCESDDVQYILFLIDTSGSIGFSNFRRITEGIGNITALFCKPVQIAMMTFNHEFNLEFCFNCYDNNLQGRFGLKQAISNIQYRGGLTHTGGAAKCACTDLLQQSCGLPQSANCLDIVFITDGKSNDPRLEICEEVRCLHRRGLNTFAMGIGNYNLDELQCIAQASNEFSTFQFESFDEFERALKDVVDLLIVSNGEYSCLNRRGLPDNMKK